MKFVFFFFISVFNIAFAQTTTNIFWTEKTDMPANDIIFYNAKRNLVWADFKGTPPPPSRVAAITSSGFGYNANMASSNGKGTINVSVYCYFTKSKSWVRVGKTTSYILTHEQHHFDVSYIAACFFMDKLKNTVITTANVNTLLPRLYKESIDLMNKMQDDYDGQTMNGQNVEQQEKWNGFFTQKIASLTK